MTRFILYIFFVCKFRPWQILIPFYVLTNRKKFNSPNTYAMSNIHVHSYHLCDDFGQAESIAEHGNEHAEQVRKDEMEEKYVEWKQTVLYRYIAETTNTYANSIQYVDLDFYYSGVMLLHRRPSFFALFHSTTVEKYCVKSTGCWVCHFIEDRLMI